MYFILRREYLLHCGSFRGFGNKGIMDSKIDYNHRSCLESLSNLLEEPCEVVDLVLWGFFSRVRVVILMKQPVDS
jgi:hypothetical protein